MRYKIITYAPIFFLVLLLVPRITFSQDKVSDSITLQIIENQKLALKNIDENNYQIAINKLINAKKSLSKIENDSLAVSVRLDIAKLYYTIKNFKKAANEIESIVLIANNEEANISKMQLGKTFALSGLILTQLQQHAAAEVELRKADKVFIDLKDEKERSNVLLGFGLLAIQKEEFTKATNYFDAAIPTFKKYNDGFALATSKLKKAEALLKLENSSLETKTDMAETAFNEALAIITDKNYTSLRIDSYLVSGLLSIEKGDFNKGTQYFNNYIIEKEKQYQNYINAVAQGIDEESKIKDLNDIIASQKKDLIETEESMSFIKMTTALSVALIVILSLLTLSLQKNNNLRANANNILRDKNVELQLSKEKAEQASLIKAQFLSTITHELRTPLYAVTGLTHLLLEEDPKEHQKEHLNSLRLSGEFLLSLINNILDLNKLEANKVEIEHTTFNLRKRIDDVLMSLKKSAETKKNTLQLEYDESIPVKLKGDPVVISQILVNLIGNAIKFTQNGEVIVRVNAINQTDKKATLHFEIEDNGVGISNKKQEVIFDSFSQASLQVNRKYGGTGLGLSIVKNLLELLNSKIELDSTLGKGSKFWFNISLDIDHLANNDLDNTDIEMTPNYDNLANKHILVVEDNKINQMITRKILEKQNVLCKVASNGLEAVKIAENNTFDIILMDIHMPGISGIQATQKIRKFDPNTPIIALTAVTIDENINEFYKAGFNDIIPKPFKTEIFFHKIQKALLSKVNS